MMPTPPSDWRIRACDASHASQLSAMAAELAREEGIAHPPVDAAQLRSWLEADPPALEALIAEDDDAPLGYLVSYRAFSLFKPGPVLLVENIYVRPQARRRGIGAALLAQAAAMALARGWSRMELAVRPDNREALAAYQAAGFHAPGMVMQRIEDGDLAALARRAHNG